MIRPAAKGHSPAQSLAKRFWRIFPSFLLVYWSALFIFAAVVATLDHFGLDRIHRGAFGLELTSPGEFDRARWLGNLTLAETWRPRVAGQFYPICFSLVLTPTRLYWSPCDGNGGDSQRPGPGPGRGRGLTDQRHVLLLWHEFADGLAVYRCLNVLDLKPARHAVDLAFVGLLATACTHGLVSTTASARLGLLLIALRRFDDRLGSLSGLDPVRACGRRPHGIYLIHLPVCVVGNAVPGEPGLTLMGPGPSSMVPITSAATIGVVRAFHRLVDHHFPNPATVLPEPSDLQPRPPGDRLNNGARPCGGPGDRRQRITRALALSQTTDSTQPSTRPTRLPRPCYNPK